LTIIYQVRKLLKHAPFHISKHFASKYLKERFEKWSGVDKRVKSTSTVVEVKGYLPTT